jgi:hypothetical protein
MTATLIFLSRSFSAAAFTTFCSSGEPAMDRPLYGVFGPAMSVHGLNNGLRSHYGKLRSEGQTAASADAQVAGK